MDLDAVRTFVAVADAGQFSEAAVDLSVTQQAVSKRIAALEKDLGVRLFARTARGSQLTMDGRAFLPHARDLLQAAERAAASVRPGRRALRVDVIGRHLAPAGLLRDFHRANPETELDVVTLFDADAAIAAIWRADNPHPALAALRGYLGSRPPRDGHAGTWTPPWDGKSVAKARSAFLMIHSDTDRTRGATMRAARMSIDEGFVTGSKGMTCGSRNAEPGDPGACRRR